MQIIGRNHQEEIDLSIKAVVIKQMVNPILLSNRKETRWRQGLKQAITLVNKKNSYGCAGQFNADQLLAKYRQNNSNGGISNSFSTSNIDPSSNGLITSIKEKNSRNIERFADKAVIGSNSILDTKESNSQYLISSDQIKGDSLTQNMSFDVNQRQRMIKSKKK